MNNIRKNFNEVARKISYGRDEKGCGSKKNNL